MNLICRQIAGCQIVEVDGDVVNPEDLKLREFLQNLIDKDNLSIVLDFSSVSFIDSSGISTLLKLALEIRAKGGDLHLACLNKILTDIFTQIGLDHVFKQFTSIDDAMNGFAKAEME